MSSPALDLGWYGLETGTTCLAVMRASMMADHEPSRWFGRQIKHEPAHSPAWSSNEERTDHGFVVKVQGVPRWEFYKLVRPFRPSAVLKLKGWQQPSMQGLRGWSKEFSCLEGLDIGGMYRFSRPVCTSSCLRAKEQKDASHVMAHRAIPICGRLDLYWNSRREV